MKKAVTILSILLLLTLSLTACNSILSTGAMQTENVNVPTSADKNTPWEVRLEPGAAAVNVGNDGEGVLQGTVSYNVEQLKPNFYTFGNRVEVSQGNTDGILPNGTKNDWNLKLGQGIPMNLTVNTGASKGNWELGGLSLRSLNFSQGAADTRMNFSQPNPQSMENITISSGAASLRMQGLGNANIKSGTFSTGAGSMELSFDGKLTQNADIRVKGGASSLTVYAAGNPVQVIREDGGLSSINRGSWSKFGETYESPEWANASGPKITIHLELGVGSLNLK